MLELPHAAVGATIAVLIPNPFIAVPLALTSHFVMDLYPHWNPHIKQEIKRFGRITSGTMTLILVDSLAALIMGLSLAKISPHPWTILICCFMAVLPDVLGIPKIFFHKKILWLKKFSDFGSEHQSNLAAPAGIYTQIAVLIVCFLLIFKKF